MITVFSFTSASLPPPGVPAPSGGTRDNMIGYALHVIPAPQNICCLVNVRRAFQGRDTLVRGPAALNGCITCTGQLRPGREDRSNPLDVLRTLDPVTARSRLPNWDLLAPCPSPCCHWPSDLGALRSLRSNRWPRPNARAPCIDRCSGAAVLRWAFQTHVPVILGGCTLKQDGMGYAITVRASCKAFTSC